jgi:hypothetical protein
MTNQAPKISALRLRQLIAEELERITELNDGPDYKAANSLHSAALKLMTAIEAFKEKAPPAAINSATPHLGQLEVVLRNMLDNPGSYIPKPKKEPKVVSLSAKKDK